MHTKTGTMGKTITLAAAFAFIVFGTPISFVQAQTFLSSPPVLPFQHIQNHAPQIPSVKDQNEKEKLSDDATGKFTIPLVLNESVEDQIEFFTTRGRTIFQSWLKRSARYLPIMKKIFREHNLPEDLVYVAMIESGFNVNAVSPKKAVGPWQFMRATAQERGLNTDYWVDERKDPIKSTRAAAAHLKLLYDTFGSWPMALASYNAGTGRMQGAVTKARSDDFWEIRASSFLCVETREYVPRFMAAMIIAKDPLAYGFQEHAETEPFEYEEVEVSSSIDLRRIADYTGSTFEKIRELNPELLSSITPRTSYILRIPPGTKAAYKRSMAKISVQQRKLREIRDRARSGGLLFTRMASSPAEEKIEASVRNSIITPYREYLDQAVSLSAGVKGQKTSLQSQALNRTAERSIGLP